MRSSAEQRLTAEWGWSARRPRPLRRLGEETPKHPKQAAKNAADQEPSSRSMLDSMIKQSRPQAFPGPPSPATGSASAQRRRTASRAANEPAPSRQQRPVAGVGSWGEAKATCYNDFISQGRYLFFGFALLNPLLVGLCVY